jgi:hypothetical protein
MVTPDTHRRINEDKDSRYDTGSASKVTTLSTASTQNAIGDRIEGRAAETLERPGEPAG